MLARCGGFLVPRSLTLPETPSPAERGKLSPCLVTNLKKAKALILVVLFSHCTAFKVNFFSRATSYSEKRRGFQKIKKKKKERKKEKHLEVRPQTMPAFLVCALLPASGTGSRAGIGVLPLLLLGQLTQGCQEVTHYPDLGTSIEVFGQRSGLRL